ncbi:MAG: VCBS repeat-containing protein [Alphaproteobacteria bacterium]|nr:VCBS repeat-containing protein [Alphaproteobacteria bacterium]
MKRLLALLVAVVWLVAPVTPALAAEWTVEFVAVPTGIADLFDDQGRTIALTRSGVFFRIGTAPDGRVIVDRLGSYERAPGLRRADMLPDGLVALGAGEINEAYLIGPTSRYRHGVIGDAIEASGLRIQTNGGDILDYRLPTDSVLEDIVPRLHDVDGDGKDEVVVVRSYIEAGSALAVFGLREGRLALIAEAAPIGQPSRWLNPVGVADFDGDGRLEIAVVKTPHIGGVLQLYEIEGGTLKDDHSARGFSNHFIGSRDLFLSRVADIDGDGTVDIVLPSADRGSLRVVSFAAGRFKDLGETPLPARVQTRMLGIDGATGAFAFGLADGALAVVRPRGNGKP